MASVSGLVAPQFTSVIARVWPFRTKSIAFLEGRFKFHTRAFRFDYLLSIIASGRGGRNSADDPEIFGGPGRPLDVCGVPARCVTEVAGIVIWIIEINDKEPSTTRMSASGCGGCVWGSSVRGSGKETYDASTMSRPQGEIDLAVSARQAAREMTFR